MAATVIVLPVLGSIIGGAIQLGLLFEAKATVNYAILQAARAGMTNSAERETINTGFMRGMAPLYASGEDIQSISNTLTNRVFPDVIFNSCIRILNPTQEAVAEFQQGRALPNAEISQLSTAVGASGVNVQDANILKVYVVYGARMIIPLIGPIIARALEDNPEFGEFERQLLARNRLPIMASATVHMQSRLIPNDYLVSQAELESGDLCSRNILRSYLTLPNYGDTARQCLIESGGAAAVNGANCSNCRNGIIPVNGQSTCGACVRELSAFASCFNGNDL
jgi:hypothetical protein